MGAENRSTAQLLNRSRPRPLSVPVLSQLAAGTTGVVLGLFPVLAALGLLETEDEIGPFARVLAFLFGGIFVTVGGAMIGNVLLRAARAHGAAGPRDALHLGLRHLLRRPTWASVGAGLWVAALAVGYWLAASGGTAGWAGGVDGLRALVIIEFLVIHGFPFIVVATLFVRNTEGKGRLLAGSALGLLGLLYAAFAWGAGDGIWGLAALGYLMMPNVLAFLSTGEDVSGRVLVTSRWVIKFALLVLTTGVLGGGSFDGPETVWIGAVYFTVLAGVEVFRVVEVPGELAVER